MRVLVAMSGGVDSAVAAALALEAGHDVVGATMKLWGGESDSGCCSAADVTDAWRVCDGLGIDHRVFNFADEFADFVVAPYVEAHRRGTTPNPCVACNVHLKFGSFLERARRLGFDAVATGHHARRDESADGAPRLRRAADVAKDQSYVLSVLSRDELTDALFPVGELTKDEVRQLAAARGIRVWAKPDSQDVCFITSRAGGSGRRGFLSERMALHEAKVVEAGSGKELGKSDALELLTVGQRRGLDLGSNASRRFVVSIDVESRLVVAGTAADLEVTEVTLESRTWTGAPLPVGTEVSVQTSAHGVTRAAVLTEAGIAFVAPARRVAPGQLVAYYQGDVVVGAGMAR